MTESITEPNPVAISGSGTYDSDTGIMTIVATGENGVTLTAVVEPSDEGFASLELVWQAFPQVAGAVTDDIADKIAEAQAAQVAGFTTDGDVSGA